MRAARRAGLGVAALAALLAGLAALRPAPLIRWALPRVSVGGAVLSADRVTGNLLRGLTFEGFVWAQPGARAFARRVRVAVLWPALLRRELRFEALEVSDARVRLDPASLRRWGGAGPRGRWAVSIKRLKLERAFVEVAGASGPRRFQIIGAAGGLTRGRRGWTQARVAWPGGSARLRLEGEAGLWRLESAGAARGAAFSLWARSERERWEARVKAAVPLVRAGRAAALGPIVLRARAAGSGWSPAKAVAAGRFTLAASSGPALSGELKLSQGQLAFDAAVSSGAQGSARGRFVLADRSLRVAGSLSGAAGALSRLGVRARSVRASGRARGVWPAVSWSVQGEATGVERGALSAARVEASASGTGARARVRARAESARVGRVFVRGAEVEADGAVGDHGLAFSVETDSLAARGRAAASWGPRGWTARWSELELLKPRAMRSERPFTTRARAGWLEIEGLSLAGERDSHLALSARRTPRGWQRLDARVKLDLHALWELGVWRAPMDGRFDAEVALSGDLHAPSGTVKASVEHAEFAFLEAGRAELAARLDGEVARIDRFEWKLGRGRAEATGSLPLRLGEDGPDFSIRLRSERWGLAALARRLTALELVKPRLDSDLTIRRAAGRWELGGAGRVTLERAVLPAAGLTFGPSEVEFAAEGRKLVVRRSALRPQGKGARAELSGWAGPEGPALRLTAQRLRFDTGRGLSGESDAVVDLGGTWRAQVVTGTAGVSRADFVPLTRREKRRIDEETAAAPRPAPGPVAVDLRVVFDRNAWYKEKATSIEMKGDLRLRKKPYEPTLLIGTVDTVRGDYVYFSRVFNVEQGTLKFAGETPQDATVAARALYVDEPTRTKVHLLLTGTLREPKLTLTSEPPMDERDIVSFLVFGRPLYQVAGDEGHKVGGTEEAAKVMADYVSQGLRRYLPPQLGLDVFRVDVNSGRAGMTVGRYLTRRLFVSYGQTMGAEGDRKVDAAYTLSPHWSVETQNTRQRGVVDNVVDLLFNVGFK